MAIDLAIKTKLLGAIETDTLIFLCGAGLSMPKPSELPSAEKVAEICYDKWQATEVLDAALRWDVDALAGHFYAKGDFASVFMHLVPWNELTGTPNKGHAAISDMLLSRAAHGALSANFDCMIERWAEQYKVALRGALNGQEATNFSSVSNPLVKFHGCMTRERECTLWTQGQLVEPDVQTKIQSCSQWMSLNLPGRHLVVVGFWTDWGYLNDVLADAFAINNALSVTVVDTKDSAALQAKAPTLWAKLNALSASFTHIQASSDDVLEELRLAYCQTWAKKFYAMGKPMADTAGIAAAPTPDALSLDDLYRLRQDVEGVSYTRAATLKNPPAAAGEAAFAHIELASSGATQSGAWLQHDAKTIRIINGAGHALNDVREGHVEPATVPQPDIVLCTGVIDLGVPAKLIASGKGASIINPAPGGGAKWLTRQQALTELGL